VGQAPPYIVRTATYWNLVFLRQFWTRRQVLWRNGLLLTRSHAATQAVGRRSATPRSWGSQRLRRFKKPKEEQTDP